MSLMPGFFDNKTLLLFLYAVQTEKSIQTTQHESQK